MCQEFWAAFTPGHVPGNMCPGRATCNRIHICWRTHVARQQVARSGYMLTVSWRHNYYSFMSRSTCIALYPSTDGRQTGKFCCRYKKHVDGNRTHVAENLLPGNMCPGVNAALAYLEAYTYRYINGKTIMELQLARASAIRCNLSDMT